jgi:hypothetical protein
LAKSLPYGGKRKVVCCGGSPSAIVSNNVKGISFYCFRSSCDRKEFEPHGERSLAEVMATRQAEAEIKQQRVIPKRCLPLSHPEVPYGAVLWVLQSNLSPEEATDVYGMMYDPKTRRVCIPIQGGFLARSVFKDGPKYIKAGEDTQYYLLRRSQGPLVVCEDIMSAIQVHRSGYSAMAILGTSLTGTTARVMAEFNTIVCWTDGDKAGDAAWVTLRKKMALYPVTLTRVRTDVDPKEIHRGEIVRFIEEILCRSPDK